MTGDPTRVGDRFSDEALFADHPAQAAVEPATYPTEETAAAVETVLRVLRAANLSPAYGFDAEDAQQLWTARLGRYAPEAIVTAAATWTETEGAGFPTLAEFETVVRSADRKLRHPAPKPEDGRMCPECQATPEERRGFVDLTDPTEGGTGTVRPCRECRPEQYELWRQGHFSPRPQGRRCHCNHPLCRDRKARTA